MDSNGNLSHSYYICGQDHNKGNREWTPFQMFDRHCRESRYDFYEAKDVVEEWIERKLKCECEILK